MVAVRAAAIACICAFLLTPLLREAARRLELMDVPGDRSMHAVPTPRSGGWAILIGLFLGVATFSGWTDGSTARLGIAVLVLAGLAITDELRPLPVALRFAVQLGVATWAVLSTGISTLVTANVSSHVTVIAVVVAVLWLTWMTNAYNFMDGINGIGSIEAIVAGATLCVMLGEGGDAVGGAVALALAGAALGFIPWNLPSGSIFMGDVGSTTLGFSLAFLTLRACESVPVSLAVLPLFPFLFDATFTLLRRMVRGERFYAPHRTHVYQRLVTQGWSHASVTALYGLLAILCGIAALWARPLGAPAQYALLAMVFLGHVALARTVYSRERTAGAGEMA